MLWLIEKSFLIKSLEYHLSSIIWKDRLPFSRKYDLTHSTENETWFFSKEYMEIWYFLQVFWKFDLFKKFHPNMIFFVLSGNMGLFPENLAPFPWTENESPSFSRNTWKKNHKWSHPAKIHLKVIGTLDWHSRKSSNNSLYFYGTCVGVFIYCFPAK